MKLYTRNPTLVATNEVIHGQFKASELSGLANSVANDDVCALTMV